MKLIELEPLETSFIGEDCIRKCKIIRIDNNIKIDEDILWFQFDNSITPPDFDDCDSYLLAIIMVAMREKRHINVRGKVSQSLLSNLTEYQAAWHKWLPEVYDQIIIKSDVITTNHLREKGAICAFSGGVDATFSVWRHTQQKNQHRSQNIKMCAFVHGFDIPIEAKDEFSNAFARSAITLEDVDLNLVSISTNYRQVIKGNWEHIFSCALVVVLNNFKIMAGTGIVGSSESYDSLIIPWGSSPITDHLLGSDEFVVIHDGASHNRTEKVKEIVHWSKGIENLRVCWEGDLKDKNCGKCEKCLRTQLNFLASGTPVPKCFPVIENIVPLLKHIVLKNKATIAEWEQIYLFAHKEKIKSYWVEEIPKVIRNKPVKTKRMILKSMINYSFPENTIRRRLIFRLKNGFNKEL